MDPMAYGVVVVLGVVCVSCVGACLVCVFKVLSEVLRHNRLLQDRLCLVDLAKTDETSRAIFMQAGSGNLAAPRSTELPGDLADLGEPLEAPGPTDRPGLFGGLTTNLLGSNP